MADTETLDDLVRRVDPDRWLATRFIADPAVRADVIALYGLNYELARVAGGVSNALMGEIRLTWWREAMEEIGRARMRGQKIAGETCPQYLVLTAEDLDTENFEGAKYVCSPPPRDKPSQDACWQGLETGVFDLFSSDHCPFRFEDSAGKKTEKGRKSFRWIPNGIPGVGTRLQILFSQGVAKGRIDVNRFVELTATNHAKLYGLYPQKGTIAVGSDADIAIWDPTAKGTIRNADLQHGADYTPYEGMEITGRPVTVLLRGEVAVENGELVAETGRGTYLPRGQSSLFR